MVATLIEKSWNAEDCRNILKKLENTPVEIIDFQISKLSDKVVGFLGDHFNFKIRYRKENDPKIHEALFFAKTLPKFNQMQMDYVIGMGVFKKEVLAYKNLLNDLLDLCEIPFAPRFYYAKENEGILLENLAPQGYKIKEKSYFSFEEIVSFLKTLGRMHASSLIYEELRSKDGKQFRICDNFEEELVEGTFSFIDGHPRQKWLKTVTKTLIECIKLIPNLDNCENICKNLHYYVYNILPELLKPSKKFRNVICHDDLWCNNIMFNDQLDCKIVDFQLVRYTPPAPDILLGIYANLDTETVKKHYDELIEIYYITVCKELVRYRLKPDVVFPKDQFLEGLESYKLFGLIECCMYGTNIFISDELSNEVVSDLDNFQQFVFLNREKYITKEFLNNQKFRERMMTVFEPTIQLLQKMTIK